MPFNQNKKGMDMKKELVLLGSMVAMSAALSSCCCNKGANAAYRQNQQNVYATAPRVVNYKDGGTVRGTPGYIQPTSAEGTTLTAPVQQPVYQQPVRQSPFSQVQPAMNVQPVRYNGPMIVPSPGVIEANMNYSNSGVPYNAVNGCGDVYMYSYGVRNCHFYSPSHCYHRHHHYCR